MQKTHGHGLLSDEKRRGRWLGDKIEPLPDAERALEAAVGDVEEVPEAALDGTADLRGQ